MGITSITFCNNEEPNLPDLAKCLTGIDERIVINHLSTDKTEELAKELGFTVITQGNVVDEATQEDVDDFRERYGFLPVFTAGNKLPNWPVEMNRIKKIAQNDWILWIDADERLEWDESKIRPLLPDYDVITFDFINPMETFTCVKFARRDKTWWSCRIHSALVGDNVKIKYTDAMRIIHHQRVRDYRAGYLPTLEYTYLKEESTRANYYLAREYYNYHEYDKAIQFFLIYLKSAYDKAELVLSYTMLSIMYWKKGMEEEAFSAVYHALRIDPTDEKALMLMSEMVRPKDGMVWKKYIEANK